MDDKITRIPDIFEGASAILWGAAALMPEDTWLGYPLILTGLASFLYGTSQSNISLRWKIAVCISGVFLTAFLLVRAKGKSRKNPNGVAVTATPLGFFRKRMDDLIVTMKKIKETATMDNLYSKTDEMIAWEKQMRRDICTAFDEDGYFALRQKHHLVMNQAQVDPINYKKQSNRMDAFNNFMLSTDGYIGFLEAIKAQTLAEHFSPHYRPEDLGK